MEMLFSIVATAFSALGAVMLIEVGAIAFKRDRRARFMQRLERLGVGGTIREALR